MAGLGLAAGARAHTRGTWHVKLRCRPQLRSQGGNSGTSPLVVLSCWPPPPASYSGSGPRKDNGSQVAVGAVSLPQQGGEVVWVQKKKAL